MNPIDSLPISPKRKDTLSHDHVQGSQLNPTTSAGIVSVTPPLASSILSTSHRDNAAGIADSLLSQAPSSGMTMTHGTLSSSISPNTPTHGVWASPIPPPPNMPRHGVWTSPIPSPIPHPNMPTQGVWANPINPIPYPYPNMPTHGIRTSPIPNPNPNPYPNAPQPTTRQTGNPKPRSSPKVTITGRELSNILGNGFFVGVDQDITITGGTFRSIQEIKIVSVRFDEDGNHTTSKYVLRVPRSVQSIPFSTGEFGRLGCGVT
ncbi:hypothetical protein WG66_008336 [Moniliophthora roreri]|nr:hypothetical protein WG66_008336 [Moniliophthora roreri]